MNSIQERAFVVPDAVVSHFHIKTGDVVADFGTGAGHFISALSRRVGEGGRVYACEIQKVLIEKVSEYARREGLHNVHPLWCDLEESQGLKISSATVDVGILVNTLFQIENRTVAIEEMSRTLRSKGRLIVIDWTDSYGGMGPHQDHVITAPEVAALLEAKGFVLEKEFPAGSHHYGLVFRKI